MLPVVMRLDVLRSQALLIGIGDDSGTGWGSLANAERAVNALAAPLESMRAWDLWEVMTLSVPQATKRAIEDAFADLSESTQNPDSRAYIYCAGHGDQDLFSSEDCFIVPVDARPVAEEKGRSSYPMYSEGFDYLFNGTKAKLVLLSLDCCFGGGVSNLRGGVLDQPTDKLLRRKAHLVFSSSCEDEQAQDGEEGKHSPFAQAFLGVSRADKEDRDFV